MPVDWERGYKPHTHTLGEWQKHFATFKRLYVTERRGLLDVREIMAREYDFYATYVYYFTPSTPIDVEKLLLTLS